MTRLALALLAALAVPLALAGCDKGKPRHPPPDPFAAPPPPAEAATPIAAATPGLPKREGQPGFFLDRIGAAIDPMNRPPAPIAAADPVLLNGFGFDAAARLPAKAIDVVIDGQPYGTEYGLPRDDVAAYFKAPALARTGFRTTLPAGTLAAGPHLAWLRVVAADGQGVYESPTVAFTAR